MHTTVSSIRYKWVYPYSFCQIFQGLRLFKGVRFFLDSRVFGDILWILQDWKNSIQRHEGIVPILQKVCTTQKLFRLISLIQTYLTLEADHFGKKRRFQIVPAVFLYSKGVRLLNWTSNWDCRAVSWMVHTQNFFWVIILIQTDLTLKWKLTADFGKKIMLSMCTNSVAFGLG